MATPADVIRIAPEFSTLDPVTVLQPFIDDAVLEVNASAWGDQTDRAIALLAAHAIACAYPNLYKRLAQSNTVGGVSQTYVSSSPMSGLWGTTRFGLEYLRLLRTLGLSVAII
jgi:hypothetical protein